MVRRKLAIRSLHDRYDRNYAAITIQCAFRCHVAYELFLGYRFYAIELQRYVRSYIVRKEIKSRDYAASLIQQAWWSYVLYTETEMAATCLQKSWRGVLGRRKYTENRNRHIAACTIQKIWRGYYQSLVYCIAVESSVVLQKVSRGFIARKSNPIEVYRQSATSIQKIWRGFSVQVQFQIDILDIVCIQSLARRKVAKRDCLNRVDALAVLQCAYRCFLARRKAIIKINAKIEERCHCQAAIMIQSNWRGHRFLSAFQRSKAAVISIQKLWKGHESRQRIKTQLFAATLIQSCWRKYWVYSDYQMFINESKSAILIQAHARRMVTRRRIIMRNKSASTIQRRWHQFLQHELEKYSVTRIQTCLRHWLARKYFLRLRCAAITIQKSTRAHHARKEFLFEQKANASITIQKIWRGFSKQVQFQMDIMDIVYAQSLCRKFLASKAYRKSIKAASVIQRSFRCATARHEKFLRKIKLDALVMSSIIKIQTKFRSFVVRYNYLAMKDASLNIQKRWRGHITRRFQNKLCQGGTKIQSKWRMHRCRSKYSILKDSATKMQSLCRVYFARRRFLILNGAALDIQRFLRGYKTRKSLVEQSRAITMIQSHWRRSFAQNNYLLYLLETRSSTMIQASFRMYMRRMDYMVIKFAAHTIQRYVRGFLSRVDLEVQHFAASEIQRIWRGYCTYSFKTILHSTIKIQSVIRMATAKKKLAELKVLYWAEMCYRQRNAVTIQISYRKYRNRKKRDDAAIKIQIVFRFYSQLKRIQRASRGIITLQSLFRAIRIRKNRSMEVIQVAHRINKETRKAILNPNMRLGFRTSRALEILQTSQSLTKIMDAVKELETSTRYVTDSFHII